MNDPLKPSLALLVKLGSIVIHMDELLHPVKGHVFDKYALDSLASDPDVQEWIQQMNKMAMLPVKR